jgi:hypothetical protein
MYVEAGRFYLLTHFAKVVGCAMLHLSQFDIAGLLQHIIVRGTKPRDILNGDP